MDHETDISSLLEIYEEVTDHSHDLRTDTYIHVPGPRENLDVSAGPPCSIGEFVSYPPTLCLGVSPQNGSRLDVAILYISSSILRGWERRGC